MEPAEGLEILGVGRRPSRSSSRVSEARIPPQPAPGPRFGNQVVISNEDLEDLGDLEVVGRRALAPALPDKDQAPKLATPPVSDPAHLSPSSSAAHPPAEAAGPLQVVGRRPGLVGRDKELAAMFSEADLSPRHRGLMATLAGMPAELPCNDEEDAVGQQWCFADTVWVHTICPIYFDQLKVTGPALSQLPFRERLMLASPVTNVQKCFDWAQMVAAEPSEALSEPGAQDLCVDINSGGQVFFVLLALENETREGGAVLKFCDSRHMLQSEQMAAELAQRLGLSPPGSRLVLRNSDTAEWQNLEKAASQLNDALCEALNHYDALLLLQYVPGCSMSRETVAWKPENLDDSCRAIGRLLMLDLLLGNSDRLPLKSLAWRGNPSNVLWQKDVFGEDRCVPIDAVVARRPPRRLVQDADRKIARLLELVLLDLPTAYETLLEAVFFNGEASAAIEADWASGLNDECCPPSCSSVAGRVCAASAFQEGVQLALALALQEQGLLEMVGEVVASWLEQFHTDMRTAARGDCVAKRPQPIGRQTMQLQRWDREAHVNDQLRDRLASWQVLMQDKSKTLYRAVEDWSSRRKIPCVLSFQGFLGPSVPNPVADAYELLVRLHQLIARGKVLAGVAGATRPSSLAPLPLLVGPATSAHCLHLLRLLGVSYILNLTADLPSPPAEALGGDIQWHRLAFEWHEEQSLSEVLREGFDLVAQVEKDGGCLLVHCHEGRSRSVTFCMAYLVACRRMSLAEAWEFLRSHRPEGRPHAGHWRQLLALELSTLGTNSLDPSGVPMGKPKGIICDVCGQVVGLTEGSLVAHKKLRHPKPMPVTLPSPSPRDFPSP